MQKTSLMTSPTSPRKRGRPSKGDRKAWTARTPDDLTAVLTDAAANWDNRNDFLNWALATAVGRPDLAPSTQEVLPLRSTA